MTTGGWIVMLVSVGGMTGLLTWCVARVMSEPAATQKLHSQADIDTRDREP